MTASEVQTFPRPRCDAEWLRLYTYVRLGRSRDDSCITGWATRLADRTQHTHPAPLMKRGEQLPRGGFRLPLFSPAPRGGGTDLSAWAGAWPRPRSTTTSTTAHATNVIGSSA
jgi:hypothetical protein